MKTKKRVGCLMASLFILHFGLAQSVMIAPGDNCSGAVDISAYIGLNDNKATCIIGDNFQGTSSGSSPSCWASSEDADVWYKFTVPGTSADTAYWNISMDNGINDFGEDTQLALWDACGGTIMACNEDLGDSTEANTLAAGFNVLLVGGKTYYLQVDIFGTVQGKTALSVLKNHRKPENDCILDAISLDNLYCNLTPPSTFISKGWYIYNLPDVPGVDNDPKPDHVTMANGPNNHDADGATSNNTMAAALGSNNRRFYFDVWFKMHYDTTKCDVLFSVIPKNAEPWLGIEVWRDTDAAAAVKKNKATLEIKGGIERVGWALPLFPLPGVVPESGTGPGEASSNNKYPRINLRKLEDLGKISHCDTLYFRIYQYNELGQDGNGIGRPGNGKFKVRFEKVDSCGIARTYGGDHYCCLGPKLNKGCDDPGTNFCAWFYNLSNAGMNGGVNAIGGSTSTPLGSAFEPGSFTVLNGTTRADHNCTGNEVITGGKIQIPNNNSVFFPFSVGDAVRVVDISGIDTLLSVTINDSTIFVPGVGPIPSEDISAVIALCSGVTVDVLNIGSGLFCPDSIVTTCGADVLLTFNKLRYDGINGAGAEFFVIRLDSADCSGGSAVGEKEVVAAFGELSTFEGAVCDTCISMGPSSFYLPSGDYALVVDGEDGALVNFDLQLCINYFIPGTIIPCGIECSGNMQQKAGNTLKPARTSLFDLGIRPTFLAPQPAGEYTDFGFTAAANGMVVFRIINLEGRVMDSGSFEVTEGENIHRFDVSMLNSGMYVLSLELNGVRTEVRMVMQ